jgi:hypothetical protein
MQASQFTKILLCFFCIFPLALCLTKRSALVRIQNNTPHSFSGVSLSHKYSDVYNEAQTWESIPSGGYSPTYLTVHYHTGAFTTGRDWWLVSGHNDEDKISHNSMSLWYSDPDNFRSFFDWLEKSAPTIVGAALKLANILQPELAEVTKVAKVASEAIFKATLNDATTAGYKQHILRAEDDGKVVTIRINNDGTINILSPSGESDTVYHTKDVSLGL